MKKGNRPVIYGDGNQNRDFINVDDVVNANILAATGHIPFGVYNVGTGKNYTFNQVIGLLNKELGTEIKPNYIPNPVTNYVQETLCDPTLARQDLGFVAQVAVEEGIKQLVHSTV
jgi:UDP-glucose 4-epimerase